MSLDEKRMELEQKVLNGEIDIRKIFVLVKEQDKQFIKELKEVFCVDPKMSEIDDWANDKINKIFGKGLI